MERVLWSVFEAALPNDDSDSAGETTESKSNEVIPGPPPLPTANFFQDSRKLMFLKSKKSLDQNDEVEDGFTKGIDGIVEELKKGSRQLKKVETKNKSSEDKHEGTKFSLPILRKTNVTFPDAIGEKKPDKEPNVVLNSDSELHKKNLTMENRSLSDAPNKPLEESKDPKMQPQTDYGAQKQNQTQQSKAPILQKEINKLPAKIAGSESISNGFPETSKGKISHCSSKQEAIIVQEDAEESEEDTVEDLDLEIELVELKLKEQRLDGINADKDKSYVMLEIELRKLKLQRNKLIRKSRKKKVLSEPKHAPKQDLLANGKERQNIPDDKPENPKTQDCLNKLVTNEDSHELPIGKGVPIESIPSKRPSTDINVEKQAIQTRKPPITASKPKFFKPPPVDENQSELMKKLNRRKSLIDSGVDNVSVTLGQLKISNPPNSEEELKRTHNDDNPNQILFKSINDSNASTIPTSGSGVSDKKNDQSDINVSSSILASRSTKIEFESNTVDSKKPIDIVKLSDGMEIVSEMSVKQEKIVNIPLPPPMPLSLDLKISDKIRKNDISHTNPPPLTSTEQEIVDSHASLMKEIITGIKLRSIQTDSQHRRTVSGHRVNQDLQSILKEAVILRNIVMNPDGESEDSGNEDDAWDEFLENEPSYPLEVAK